MAAETVTALRRRLALWREEGVPVQWTVWNRSCRYWVVGGRRTRGWVLTPHVSVDLRHLTFGVYWQREAFEDPDPLVSFHVPGVCVWSWIHPVAPGYRTRRRSRDPRVYAREVA